MKLIPAKIKFLYFNFWNLKHFYFLIVDFIVFISIYIYKVKSILTMQRKTRKNLKFKHESTTGSINEMGGGLVLAPAVNIDTASDILRLILSHARSCRFYTLWFFKSSSSQFTYDWLGFLGFLILIVLLITTPSVPFQILYLLFTYLLIY